MIWRIPCKINPKFYRVPPEIFFRVASTQIFFWFISITPNFFQAATLKEIWVETTLKYLRWHPIKIWVDFKGYSSYHFSGYRWNRQLSFQDKTSHHIDLFISKHRFCKINFLILFTVYNINVFFFMNRKYKYFEKNIWMPSFLHELMNSEFSC